MQETRAGSWSRGIPHVARQLSLCTTTTEPGSQGQGTATTEARAPRAWAPQEEKPLQWEASASQPESSLCSAQLEKSPHGNEDPAQPKINKYFFFKKRFPWETEWAESNLIQPKLPPSSPFWEFRSIRNFVPFCYAYNVSEWRVGQRTTVKSESRSQKNRQTSYKRTHDGKKPPQERFTKAMLAQADLAHLSSDGF